MKIVAIRLDTDTRGIIEYKLEDGKVVNLGEALDMCKSGQLDPMYHVGSGRYGEFIATDRDAASDSHVNLKDLPQF